MTREPSRAFWFCLGFLVATLVFLGLDSIEAGVTALWDFIVQGPWT
jgi:hypothetical protein